jgi:hypothetical protein
LNALLIGTLLALGAVSFVLYPLFAAESQQQPGNAASDPLPLPQPKNDAIDALREIEFDRATGKLSDSDYDSLKASYTAQAIAAMRGASGAHCANCGYRTEQNAKFCSRCGKPV